MTTAYQTRDTKPYICDICGEPRDAYESPPTAGACPDGLVCEDCEPEQDVPLREIPSLILDLRGRLAQAQTERNQFQRERAEALAALAISRQTVDDLTAHSVSQGDYIARLQLDAETFQHTSQYWLSRSQQNFARADRLAEWIETEAKDAGYTVDDMRELILTSGVNCDECDSHGGYAAERPDGSRTGAVVKCERCAGLGMVIR